MANYIKIYLDNKQRQKFNERDLRQARLKDYLMNIFTGGQITRLKNYCQVTGASRSIYYKFALSRHSLRKLANNGFVPGVMPSSW